MQHGEVRKATPMFGKKRVPKVERITGVDCLLVLRNVGMDRIGREKNGAGAVNRNLLPVENRHAGDGFKANVQFIRGVNVRCKQGVGEVAFDIVEFLTEIDEKFHFVETPPVCEILVFRAHLYRLSHCFLLFYMV